MLEAMARSWVALALRGTVAILFGIVAFLRPGLTLQALMILLAAFALVEGAINLIAGIRQREGWALAEGALSILAGIVMLIVGPIWTAVALLYVVAAWAIITGIFRIVAAIQLRRVLRHEWLLIASGVASLIFGVIAAAFPGAGILALLWWVAAWSIVLGILLIALAFSMRQLAQRLSSAAGVI
ncbi:MAG TPA: DUF308 domain-containing protein [Candidatus Limnocylindrales bacterium]|nr:DUF308 domain-containing protein [Candidatus Limnocylindrales bacterium]